MFESLKGMAGLAGLMKDMPRIKAQLEEVKQQLGDIVVEAETGGGAVTAKVNGRLEVQSIDINPALMSALVDAAQEEDRRMAQDLVVGAVNAALVKAREAAERAFMDAAQELGLPIPPGGLAGLLG